MTGSRIATTLPGGATGVVFAEPVPSTTNEMPPPKSRKELFEKKTGGRVHRKIAEAFPGLPVLAGHVSSGNWPAYNVPQKAGHPMAG